MRFGLAIWAALAFAIALPASAAALPAGSLDPSFGTDGKLIADLYPTDNDAPVRATTDSQGRIILAGIYGPLCPCNGDVFVARLLADGTPDPTFAGDGVLDVTAGGNTLVVRGVAVQPSGRILVMYDDSGGGTPTTWTVQGVTAAGVLETTNAFGTSGAITINPVGFGGGLAVDGDGKVLVAGENNTFDFEIHRFTDDGQPDPDWNGGNPAVVDFGGNSDTPYAVALAPGAKVVVAGGTYDGVTYTHAGVARLTSAGAPDNSFSTDGMASIDFGADYFAATDVGVMADGRVVVGGYDPGAGGPDADLVVGRFKDNGDPDSAFSGDGKAAIVNPNAADAPSTLMLQSDGKVLLAGGRPTSTSTETPGAVYRFTTGGVLDTTFAGGRSDIPVGPLNSTIPSALLDAGDNRVLAVASTVDPLAGPPDDDDTALLARVLTEPDNCPDVVSPDQSDFDNDGEGDVCDPDDDNDGISDAVETAIGSNPLGTDSDSDGKLDSADACPTISGAQANGCPAPVTETPKTDPPKTDPPKVDPPGGGGPPVDRIAPRLSIEGLANRFARKKFLKSGMLITVITDEPSAVAVELVGTLKGVKLARPGDVVLGQASLRQGSGRRKLRVKVSRAQHRLIGKSAKLTLRLVATDAAGNIRRLNRSFRIR